MRHVCALLATLLLGPMSVMADEEPEIRFFYPVVTRRPVIERELETSFQHSKSREGRTSRFSSALEWPITPWWQVEVEMPFLYQNPNDVASTAGPGDLELQSKFLLWKSVQRLALLSGGFELRLPSGSERRGLGGEIAVEPFVTGGIALGPFDVIAAIAYEWNLNNVRGPREQQLTADLAVGWPVSRWFTPFLELNTVSKIQGQEDEDAVKLRGRTQLYLTPGFNVRPRPGATFRMGVELPVSGRREFDYRIHAGLVWEF
jgi:hypothetical protein